MGEPQLDPKQRETVLQQLRKWAAGHPKGGQPFMIILGQTFTPNQFLDQVERDTEIGRSFLQFLAVEAHRYTQPPETFIMRAIEANERS